MPTAPLMVKLVVMRLQGMVEALRTQQRNPAVTELSFNERLAMRRQRKRGTAGIVAYPITSGVVVDHTNPVERTITRL